MKKIGSIYLALAIFVTLIAGCGLFGDSDSTEDSSSDISETTAGPDTPQAALASFRMLLQDKAFFFQYEDAAASNAAVFRNSDDERTSMNLSSFLESQSGGSSGVQVKNFSILDMNGDGIPEMVIEITRAGIKNVFHYEKGNLYGYTFYSRGMNALKKDGSFTASAGSAHTYFQKLRFIDGVCSFEVLAFSDVMTESEQYQEAFYIHGEAVSKEMFLAYWDDHDKKEDPEYHTFSVETIVADFEQIIEAWTKKQ